jgi:hypothetical protein
MPKRKVLPKSQKRVRELPVNPQLPEELRDCFAEFLENAVIGPSWPTDEMFQAFCKSERGDQLEDILNSFLSNLEKQEINKTKNEKEKFKDHIFEICFIFGLYKPEEDWTLKQLEDDRQIIRNKDIEAQIKYLDKIVTFNKINWEKAQRVMLYIFNEMGKDGRIEIRSKGEDGFPLSEMANFFLTQYRDGLKKELKSLKFSPRLINGLKVYGGLQFKDPIKKPKDILKSSLALHINCAVKYFTAGNIFKFIPWKSQFLPYEGNSYYEVISEIIQAVIGIKVTAFDVQKIASRLDNKDVTLTYPHLKRPKEFSL